MTDVCVFPIPDCVTFPGTTFPLHVFEPRYREMIAFCVENQVPLAICHPRKVVSEGQTHSDIKQALNSNQSTYRPYPVFTAGVCSEPETTEDGRLYLTVDMQTRYRVIAEKQFLPYQIYQCEEFIDIAPNAEEVEQNKLLRDKICHRLAALGGKDETIQYLLNDEEWQAKTAEAFSFELFGLMRFDAELMQQILEMDSAHQRLQYTLDLLNSV